MNHSKKPRLRAALDTRLAVRDALAAVETGSIVLVALSGGADSLALTAATAYEARAAGLAAGAIVVDHDLQQGSAEIAARAAAQARDLGLDPVLLRRVSVYAAYGSETDPGIDPGTDSGGLGPEGAAREARYRVLAEAAAETGATVLLTAHTRDDQAEQVLLALARGSGLRSLSGIPSERELGGTRVLRPFLSERAAVTRGVTERACEELGLAPWRDPHNADHRYSRVRVRERVLPVIEDELGPGVAAALARTADLVREDADALDGLAAQVAASSAELVEPNGAHLDKLDKRSVAIPIDTLAALPPALCNRVIRRLASEHFGAHLTRERTLAIAALVTAWRGQGPIEAPGITVTRTGDSLLFACS